MHPEISRVNTSLQNESSPLSGSSREESISQQSASGASPALIRRRHLAFLSFIALSVALFWPIPSRLLTLALSDDRYSHTVVIPFITAGLLYLNKKRIFRDFSYSPKLAAALLVCAALLHFGVARWLAPSPALGVSTLALVLAWTAAFILCYGTPALRAARFPFVFLLLMVPLPGALVAQISYGFQVASAEISYVLFKLLGIPVFRDGFLFSVPGQTIRIAEVCSGIRSTTAFFITGLLLAYLLLRSGWRQFVLVVVTVLAGILKNAVRIVTLASAGPYLGVDLINSSLHHRYGGPVFSIVGMAIVIPVLLLLRRGERSSITPERT
jgi:exosortase